MLGAGTRLGPYEILSPLGSGGMGEVYRARDTRLDREIAIKVLPPGVAEDAERLGRFEREARAASALNHPNIVTLHDVGLEGKTSFLALELVDGQSLRAALSAGPLPPRKLLQIATQIADGLAAAHARGIVHRDLKPENVMVTSGGVAKILDFGLAKLTSLPGDGASGLETAPQMTEAGAVLGTVSYMSPEQASGRPVDFRSDQFSFGAILHELLTGRPAFGRKSAAETLAAILRDEPEPLDASHAAPAPLRWLVERCLAKDPDDRFASTRDLARDLASIRDHLSETSTIRVVASAAPPSRSRVLPLAAAALGGAALAALAFAALSRARPAPPARTVRFSLPPPARGEFFNTVETTTLAVSPDGARIAFIAGLAPTSGLTAASESRAKRVVWLRGVADAEARPLPNSEGATSVFWSPDGRFVAFFTPSKLKKIDVSSGAAVDICDVPVGSGKSGTWGASGDILFSSIQGSTVFRVPSSGGSPQPFRAADAAQGENRLLWPYFLPDGKRFLYTTKLRDMTFRVVLAGPGGESRTVLGTPSAAQYVEPGWLVYVQDGALVARRFDARSGRVEGDPVPIADHVDFFRSSAHATFAASAAGTIVYQPHETASRLAWFDERGREVGALSSPGNYMSALFARSGRTVLFDRADRTTGTWDVWSFDLARGVETRVTSSPETEFSGKELPRHKAVVYSATREGQPQLRLRELGSDREAPLVPTKDTFQDAEDVSPDESVLIYAERTPSSPFDIWALPLDAPRTPKLILRSAFNKTRVQFSPDGRLLAFVSDESGRFEAYVMPYPGPGEKTLVSSNGAAMARWAPDGRLVYLSLDGRVMAVAVTVTPSLSIGAPRELFRIAGKPWTSFDVAPDGRFLAVVPEQVAEEQPLDVIVGWRPAP